MLEVARLSDGQTPVKMKDVASATGLSRRFLEQLVIALKSHSLLRGVCGRHGGYLLARQSNEITIGDVLTAVLGPIQLSVCADDPTICMSSDFCSSRMIWALLQKRINTVLSEYTIADLLDARLLNFMRQELDNESPVIKDVL